MSEGLRRYRICWSIGSSGRNTDTVEAMDWEDALDQAHMPAEDFARSNTQVSAELLEAK